MKTKEKRRRERKRARREEPATNRRKRVRYNARVNKKGLFNTIKRVGKTAVAAATVAKMTSDFSDGIKRINKSARRQKTNAFTRAIDMIANL